MICLYRRNNVYNQVQYRNQTEIHNNARYMLIIYVFIIIVRQSCATLPRDALRARRLLVFFFGLSVRRCYCHRDDTFPFFSAVCHVENRVFQFQHFFPLIDRIRTVLDVRFLCTIHNITILVVLGFFLHSCKFATLP